jgi:hypothetical protein
LDLFDDVDEKVEVEDLLVWWNQWDTKLDNSVSNLLMAFVQTHFSKLFIGLSLYDKR